MTAFLAHIKKHIPGYLSIALVVVNALLANGTIHLSVHVVAVVDAVLAALGIGILHVRQQAGKP